MSVRADDVSALASMFSTKVFRALSREWILDRWRLAPMRQLSLPPGATVAEGFEAAHARLRREYRSEYLFKNELVSKVVFGRHSPRTASAIMEQPMGDSEADLLVLNGTSTVYEIKTDLDQFGRLDGQLRDYSTRAERVFVVTSDVRAAAAEARVPDHVGVIAWGRRGRIRTIRDAESNLDRLDQAHLFGMLRTAEAVKILGEKLHWVPDVPRGEVRAHAEELFSTIEIAGAHKLVVNALRTRGASAARLVGAAGFPPSLRALAYGMELSGPGIRRLLDRLTQPLSLLLGA